MNESLMKLRDLLVKDGSDILNGPRQRIIHFTNNQKANEFISDITSCPHAFVIACIADRQIKAEKAWSLPYEMKSRLGYFDFQRLARLDRGQIENVMKTPPPLHRYNSLMAGNVFLAIKLIAAKYDGDAGRMWSNAPSSASVVRRFLEFKGVGQKIASMAANILVRDFRIMLSDKYSIDISVDVHIRRVLSRMGFIHTKDSTEYIVFRARELNPDFPGIFDIILWIVGRENCRPNNPDCAACKYSQYCEQVMEV